MDENLFLTLLAAIAFALVGAVAAFVCDWLEKHH